MKNKALVLGGGDQGLSTALLAILAQRNNVIIADKMPDCGSDPFKSQKQIVYEIKSREMLTGKVESTPINSTANIVNLKSVISAKTLGRFLGRH